MFYIIKQHISETTQKSKIIRVPMLRLITGENDDFYINQEVDRLDQNIIQIKNFQNMSKKEKEANFHKARMRRTYEASVAAIALFYDRYC